MTRNPADVNSETVDQVVDRGEDQPRQLLTRATLDRLQAALTTFLIISAAVWLQTWSSADIAKMLEVPIGTVSLDFAWTPAALRPAGRRATTR